MKVLAAISFCDIYTERSVLDPDRFQRAHRYISDKKFTEFVSALLLLTVTYTVKAQPLMIPYHLSSRRSAQRP